MPTKFRGVGESVPALEPFYPDRLASRILGMGDVLSLIEKSERAFDQQQVRQLEKKVRSSGYDLDDLLSQLRQIHKMGSLSQLVEMLPGFSKLASYLPDDEGDKRLRKVEAIILSMTVEERRTPASIDGSRRKRIARGSGTTPQDVNQLLNQFYQMQKLTKSMAQGKFNKDLIGKFGAPLR